MLNQKFHSVTIIVLCICGKRKKWSGFTRGTILDSLLPPILLNTTVKRFTALNCLNWIKIVLFSDGHWYFRIQLSNPASLVLLMEESISLVCLLEPGKNIMRVLFWLTLMNTKQCLLIV